MGNAWEKAFGDPNDKVSTNNMSLKDVISIFGKKNVRGNVSRPSKYVGTTSKPYAGDVLLQCIEAAGKARDSRNGSRQPIAQMSPS